MCRATTLYGEVGGHTLSFPSLDCEKTSSTLWIGMLPAPNHHESIIAGGRKPVKSRESLPATATTTTTRRSPAKAAESPATAA